MSLRKLINSLPLTLLFFAMLTMGGFCKPPVQVPPEDAVAVYDAAADGKYCSASKDILVSFSGQRSFNFEGGDCKASPNPINFTFGDKDVMVLSFSVSPPVQPGDDVTIRFTHQNGSQVLYGVQLDLLNSSTLPQAVFAFSTKPNPTLKQLPFPAPFPVGDPVAGDYVAKPSDGSIAMTVAWKVRKTIPQAGKISGACLTEPPPRVCTSSASTSTTTTTEPTSG
jgi:hypothetical protein